MNVAVPGQKKKKKKSVSIDQRQMAYYSEKCAKKQKHDRGIMVARAKDLIAHPKKYDNVTAAGSGAYVQNIAFDKSTGEIVDGQELVLGEAKIAEEERRSQWILEPDPVSLQRNKVNYGGKYGRFNE